MFSMFHQKLWVAKKKFTHANVRARPHEGDVRASLFQIALCDRAFAHFLLQNRPKLLFLRLFKLSFVVILQKISCLVSIAKNNQKILLEVWKLEIKARKKKEKKFLKNFKMCVFGCAWILTKTHKCVRWSCGRKIRRNSQFENFTSPIKMV